MTKRFLAWVAAALLAFGAVLACGGKAKAPETPPASKRAADPGTGGAYGDTYKFEDDPVEGDLTGPNS